MLKMTLQFSRKTPHEIFEQYANAKLKLKILEKKTDHCPKKHYKPVQC